MKKILYKGVISGSITNFPEGASNSLAHSVFKKQFDHFKTEPGIISACLLPAFLALSCEHCEAEADRYNHIIDRYNHINGTLA
jgi:hypothetical protein